MCYLSVCHREDGRVYINISVSFLVIKSVIDHISILPSQLESLSLLRILIKSSCVTQSSSYFIFSQKQQQTTASFCVFCLLSWLFKNVEDFLKASPLKPSLDHQYFGFGFLCVPDNARTKAGAGLQLSGERLAWPV